MNSRELNFNSISKNKKHSPAKIAGILFTILGILFSSILIRASLLIGEYEKIDESEALVYTGKFEKYIHKTGFRTDSYHVVLDDGTSLLVSTGAETASVIAAIKNIEKGQEITILAHPESKVILSLFSNDDIIIDFNETQQNMYESTKHTDFMFWLGLILLVSIVVYNLVNIILKLVLRKK